MKQEMFIRMSEYDEKSWMFSDAEKAVLNEAVVGQIICPRGVLVSINKDTKPLLDRFNMEPPPPRGER